MVEIEDWTKLIKVERAYKADRNRRVDKVYRGEKVSRIARSRKVNGVNQVGIIGKAKTQAKEIKIGETN